MEKEEQFAKDRLVFQGELGLTVAAVFQLALNPLLLLDPASDNC